MSRRSHLLGQVARASEIATVLWPCGFRWLVAALGLRQCEHHVDIAQATRRGGR